MRKNSKTYAGLLVKYSCDEIFFGIFDLNPAAKKREAEFIMKNVVPEAFSGLSCRFRYGDGEIRIRSEKRMFYIEGNKILNNLALILGREFAIHISFVSEEDERAGL